MLIVAAFLTLSLFSRTTLGVPASQPTSTITSTNIIGTSVKASTPSPTQPGAISTCDLWYDVAVGDTCGSIVAKYAYERLTLAEFYKWNPGVGSTCDTLWLGYYVCVGVSTTSTCTDDSTTSTFNDESSTTSTSTDESSTTSTSTDESSTTSTSTDEFSTTSTCTDESSTTSTSTDEFSTTSTCTDESSTTSTSTDESSTTATAIPSTMPSAGAT